MSSEEPRLLDSIAENSADSVPNSAMGTIDVDPGKRPPEPAATISVPGYEILSVLGRGGMGVVYKARQIGLKRIVALKMIRGGVHASQEQQLRFRREAEAVAHLQHPGIVQIYDIGEHAGHPYFSLEFIEGGSLQQKAAGTPQPPREAASLIEKVARALHYAHQNGIVHRDLKPANILLAGAGASPTSERSTMQAHETRVAGESSLDPSLVPKITDFGLAKNLEEDAGLTQSGEIMGTPSFMAPEQAHGQARDLGPLVDVYALGATLYDLLTGRPPFKGTSVIETLDQVRSQDPIPPSQLQRKIPRDLETICLKCLAKEPHRRYASAEALADDLGRFLRGEPILARATGPVERMWRWCRRYPIAAALMLTLLLGVCVSAGLTFWALGERDRADDAYKKSVEAAKNEEQQRKVAERELYHSLLSRVREAAITAQPGWTWRSLDDLAKARKLNVADEDPVEPRSLAAEVLSRFDLRETGVLAEGLDVEALTFSSDGKLLATAEKRNAFECLIKVWNFNDGTLHNTFRYSTLGSSWTSVLKGEAGKHDGLKCIAISPDGKWLVVGTRYGKLARWDTTVEKPKPVIWSGHGDNQMRSLAFSPDGNLLLSVSGNKIMTWDVSKNWKGTPLRDGKDGGVHAAFTADGKSLAIADNPILLSRDHVLDLQPLGPDTPSRRAVAFSPDGRTLAAPHGNDIELWDVETRRAARILRSPIAPEGKNVFCIGLNFSVDGSVLAATYDNSIVHFWDVAAAKLLHTMRVADRDEPTVRFCPDGRRFVVAADRRTKVFEMRPLDVRTTVAHEPFAIQDMVLSDDGATIRTLTKTSEQVEECRLAEWRTASGKLLGSERFAGLIGGQRETLFRRASLAMDRNHLLVSASAGVGSLVIPLAASGPAPRVTFPHAKRFFEVTPKEMQLRGDGVSVAANDQARAGEAVRIPASVADAGVRLRVPVAAHKANGRRCLIIAAVRVERKGDVPPTMQFTLLSAEKGRQWKSDVKLAPASTPGFQAYLCDGIDLKNAPQDEWFEIDFRVGKTDSKDIVWLESFSFLVTTAPNDVFRQGNFAFSSDGRRLWGVVNNDNVTSWHAPDFCAASVWHDSFGENLLGPSPILRLAVGTQWVLAGNDRGDIFRLSASTGEKETSWPGPGGAVRGLALHPAGDLAAVGTQKGKLRLLRIPAGETLADLPPHTQSVEAILFSKDGNLLVTGSLDQTIRVWHKRGSKYEVALTLKCAAGLSALHLSADNQTLAVLSDTERAVRVWHLDKLKTQLDGQGFGW